MPGVNSQQLRLARIWNTRLDFVGERLGDPGRDLQFRGRVGAVECDLEPDAEFPVLVRRVNGFGVMGGEEFSDRFDGGFLFGVGG